jgi:hypothetical protein
MRAHSGGGNRLPSRLGAWSDLQLLIVVWAIADGEICFELGDGEMFPPFGLVQERPSLKWTQGRSLTAQRSYGAISAHVFNNNFPVHEHEFVLPLFASEWLHCWITIFDWLVRLTENSNGFRTPDYADANNPYDNE